MKTELKDQLPPNSPDAERAALCCATHDPSCAALLAKEPTELFYDLRNRTIHTAVVELVHRGAGIDLVTLAGELRAMGRLDDVGGSSFVANITESITSSANYQTYINTLRRDHAHRLLIRTTTEALQAANENPNAVANIAAHTANALAGLAPKTESRLTIRRPSEILALPQNENDNYLGDYIVAAGQYTTMVGMGALGKSRLFLQMVIASICGIPFVGLEAHTARLRWLILQAENSNKRLQSDLAALREWVGEESWATVDECLRIHTLETDADGFLSLDNPEAQRRIAVAIDEFKPDAVGFDSLYNFGAGDLNSDKDMVYTLLEISRLARKGNPRRAIVILHHALTGRAGAAKATGYDRTSFGRNSKALFAWTRAQINIAPGGPDNNQTLVVSCGKCSNGREFPPFAIRLDPNSMIYEVDAGFDLKAWEAEVSGRDNREPLMTPDRVRELCKPLTARAELSKAIIADCGCVRQVSYRYIQKAERAGKIKFNKHSENYSPK